MRWMVVALLVVLAGCAGQTPDERAADLAADADDDDAAVVQAEADLDEPAPVREDLFLADLAADFGYDAVIAGCEAFPVLALPKAVLGDDPLAGTDHDTFEVDESWWDANFTFMAHPGPDITIAWVDEGFSAIEIHRLAGGEMLNGTIPPDTSFGGYAPCGPEPATASVEVFRLIDPTA